jgi:hypothetical protein
MLRKLATAGVGGAVITMMLLTAVAISPDPKADDAADERYARICEVFYTGSIWTNVTNDIGLPIPGAKVRVVGHNATLTTNASGAVLASGLLADTNGTEYILWAEAEGYENSSAHTITVTPGNTTYLNITVRGGVIVGTVTESGSAMAQANVSARDMISGLFMNTSTGSDGGYRLDGVKGGWYSVNASAPNHAPAIEIVYVPVGGTVALFFSLSSLTGGISGVVLHSETLDPLEKANVSVTVGVITTTVSTDANGSYYLPGLPAGVYTLTANLEGFNASAVTGIVVESGAITDEVDLLLDEKITILWGVVKAGSVLLVGANVSIIGTEYYGESSIDGEYEIVGLPAGTYSVAAALQGYNNVTVSEVEIRRGFQLQLNFNLTGLPGALYGIVVDAVTGDHLAGVTVVVLPLRETITNTNGEFQFTGLPAGEYVVRFTLDGYQPKEIGSIETTLDETTELGHIELEPIRESFGGFIFGFDLAHSMMILALFLTIIILAFAVVLRIRTFEAPDNAPAVYDELDEEEADTGKEPHRDQAVEETPKGD